MDNRAGKGAESNEWKNAQPVDKRYKKGVC